MVRVTEKHVDLETPTGPMRTYVYTPLNPARPDLKYPGVLLYSEIFQRTGPIHRLSVQFASQGYIVMVPEIYHEHEPAGTVLGYDDAWKDKGNLYKKKTLLTTYDNDAKVVIKALQAHPQCTGRIGTVGFCIGGHLSFRAALNPEVLAACCFYGTDIHSGTLGAPKSDSLERCGEIKGELLMIFGRQDPHVPEEGRKLVHDTISKNKLNFQFFEFNGDHAFMRDEGERYDAALARGCLGLAFDLFKRNL